MSIIYTLWPALPVQIAFDTSGNIVPGAVALFYLSGTSTPTPVYDSTGASLGTSVTADAFGRFVPIYLDPAITYKIDLQTSAGASLSGYPVDPVDPTPLNAANATVIGTAGENLSAGNVVYLSDGSGSKTAGRWYKADATNTYSSTLNWIGMVTAAITSGNSGVIQLEGRITSLAGLTAGTKYYVSGTPGALTASILSHARLVGQADSTTSLILTGNPLGAVGGVPLVYAAVQVAGFTAAPFTVYPCNGSFTVTLPTLVGIGGAQIKIVNRGTGTLTIATAGGGQTILGGATYSFNFGQYSSLTLAADETNLIWDIF